MIIIIFHSQTQATFESLLKVPLLRCYVYCDLAKRLSTHCQVCILFIIFVNNKFLSGQSNTVSRIQLLRKNKS